MADANSSLFINPALVAIAIKFRQEDMIADEVLPRIPTDKQEFIHLKDRIQDWITPVDTEVGRTGAVNVLSSDFQDPVYLATRNQGLDEVVPNQDQMNGPTESALMRATQKVMSLVELKREMRAAAIFMNSANFGFSAALTGTALFSVYAGYVSPIITLKYYLDQCFKRPNKLVMGRAVWTQLSQHPAILTAAFGGVNPQGGQSVSKQRLADILEIKEIIVGDGWINIANKGQTVNMQRVWGNMLAGIYQGDAATRESGNTWGYTAQFGNRIAGTIPTMDVGLFGGVKVRAGESVIEVVSAPQFGFQLAPCI